MSNGTVTRLPVLALLLVLLAACTVSHRPGRPTTDTAPGALKPPTLGACRVLKPADITRPSNLSRPLPCAKPHTAQTFAVGSFPAALSHGAPDDHALGAWIYHRCQSRFQRFLGGNASLVLRSTVTWAWFRAPTSAWQRGAHWWRCDVVGGDARSHSFQPLPTSAKGILLGKPADRWMVCVNGPTVSGSVPIPCARPHTWRAVTTIVLGKPSSPYPGDRIVEARTRDYCSDSVGAWLNYPVDYDFGYTWFHRAEWQVGNRRSICWAKTTQ